MSKKIIGLILLLCGVGIFLFVAYNFLFAPTETLSPIPDNDNIRILQLTPQSGK